MGRHNEGSSSAELGPIFPRWDEGTMTDGYIVEETYYTACCEQCDWHGQDRDNEEAAQDDLTDHNRERHDD